MNIIEKDIKAISKEVGKAVQKQYRTKLFFISFASLVIIFLLGYVLSYLGLFVTIALCFITLNYFSDYKWKKYADAETELLKKYRSRLKAYTNIQFDKYFDFRLVLAHKFILTQEQFNSIKSAAEQSLSEEEIDLFLFDAKHLLSLSLHFLYLSDTGNAEPTPQPTVTLNDTDNVTEEPDNDITKARQLLTMYYFLKASFDIEARDKNSISGIARFIHLMTGTKFTTIQNSDIYKKYLQMPNYKTDSKLIEDLKFIRPYFIDLGLESAIKMVDEEIKRAIKELPYNERKKYKGELE